MRLTLFSILAALLLVTATARRGAKTPAAPVSKKHILVPQWGFPYGWGLGPYIDLDVPEEKEKEVKQVKRGTSNPIDSRWSVHYCSQTFYCSHDPSIYSLAQLSIRRRARTPQCPQRRSAGSDPPIITTWKKRKRSWTVSSSTLLPP
jgi:hypothetical protein